MARCYLTGVGISLDEAFVLDLTIAHRVVRDLRERLATLERLTAQLGEKDPVTIRHRGGAGSHTRQDRRLVSKAVATALADACADAELFIPGRRGADVAGYLRSRRYGTIRTTGRASSSSTTRGWWPSWTSPAKSFAG